MKYSVDSSNYLSKNVDLLVVGMTSAKSQKGTIFEKVDLKLKKTLTKLFKKEEIKGESGQSKLVYTNGDLKARYVLVIGLGEKNKFSLEIARVAGASIFSAGQQIKASKIVSTILGSEWKTFSQAELSQALIEGFILSQYKFEKYLKGPKLPLKECSLYCPQKSQINKVRRSINIAQILSNGVYLARDLINTPASDMTPLALVKAARNLSGVRARIHNLQSVKKMKMGAFISVAQGSTANPPYFIELHYKPSGKPKKKIAIVGKGVTFDSGGYSLKPPKAMENMKDDMAGSAAVIGLMSIVSKLNLKVEVSAYIAATENMVDGYAQRPGDICRSMSGKTIEVLNTDAEGRLTLADALTFANKKKPDYMIDMATLTGACLVALGLRYSGIMGNNQELIDKLIENGNHTGEKLWQLPLADEYRDELKSPIADLKNIGSSYAGTITAGIFLEHFVGKTKWAHLDIAGPSWTDKPLPYTPRGGCGVMVRTLARFLTNF